MTITAAHARLRRCSGFALATLAGFAAVAAQAQTAPSPVPVGPAPVKAMTLMSAVIPSSDLDKSIAFYTTGLGMTATRPPNPREVILTFPGSGSTLMLLKNAVGPNAPRRGPSRVIVQVPDLKAVAARLRAAGYGLIGEIREIPQYRIAIAELEDPDGNSLELIQRGG
jgi:predicted enzyme related to lactoylglutathione lyase